MKHPFQRLLNLVRKTGNHVVISDFEGEEMYVILPFAQYENLLNGEDDVEPPNVDDLQKNVQSMATPPPVRTIWEAMPDAKNPTKETWQPNPASVEEQEEIKKQYEQFKKQQRLESEAGEEQFYLEPVE